MSFANQSKRSAVKWRKYVICVNIFQAVVLLLSGFQLVLNWVSKVISRLLWFCFTVLYDRLEKFAPFFQPMGNQAKTNRDLLARVFPRLTTRTCICFEFWLAHCAVYVFCSHAFSRAWHRLHVFASNSDWFIGLFTSVARTRFRAILWVWCICFEFWSIPCTVCDWLE